jgi:preprotein translocase subunit SecG
MFALFSISSSFFHLKMLKYILASDWPDGGVAYAAVCKTAYAGSIPAQASEIGVKMRDNLLIVEVVLSILLVITILLQHQGTGLGGTFGGEGNAYRSRRGIEKSLFSFTIILAVLLVVTAIASFFV